MPDTDLELPDWFIDPVTNPDLPAITAWTGDDDAPVPPAERLEHEPADVVVDPLAYRPVEVRGFLSPRLAPSLGGINLGDYSRSPQARGFGAPCHVTLAKVQLTHVAVGVNSLLAELIWLIMAANEAQGYLYRAGDTGSYNCRPVAGTSFYSWHSWAVAVDSNWGTNPQRRPVVTDRPRWELDRWNRFGFAWGGDYTGSSVPDAMHTEYMGTVAQIGGLLEQARAELLPLIQGNPVPPAPVPTPAPAPSGQWHPWAGVTDLWAQGDEVRKDQADLIDTGFPVGASGADGFAGADTVTSIRSFQVAARGAVDGRFGPEERAAIHKVPSWRAGAALNLGGYPLSQWNRKLAEHGWHISAGDSFARFSAVLRQFQADKGIVADGAPGPQSWTCLYCTTN